MSRLPSVQDPFIDDPFLAALRRHAAHSPRYARPRAELPKETEELLAALIATDIVRDAGGSRYYLVHKSARREPSARFTPLSVTLMMIVWAAALLVPLIILLTDR